VSTPPREIVACFLEEADARRAADALDALFKVHQPASDESADEGRWLLTVTLPETPSLATFHVDTRLLWKVEDLVEQHGGEVWDPEVLAEVRSRLETPLSEWVTVTRAEMLERIEGENLAQAGPRRVADDEH
jgi:hypothetical protein